MSTPSVELSSYRDQHFKVRTHFIRLPAFHAYNNAIRFMVIISNLRRAREMTRIACWSCPPHCTWATCPFSRPKNKSTSCFRGPAKFGALLWAWTSIKRRHAAFAFSSITSEAMQRTRCATWTAPGWTIGSFVSTGMPASSRAGNMAGANRAVKFVSIWAENADVD